MSDYDLSRQVIEHVREAADIVTVIGEVVTLRKAGKSFLGLCPFHGEKTPSFNVSREKGTFYCFGCKRGGGVIDFVMETERLTFPEAVERLAERFGVDLPAASPEARRRRDEGDQIAEALEAAQAYYIRHLSEDRPRAFLERRGVRLEVAAEFGLGHAKAEWQGLFDHLHKRFPERVMVAAGLVVAGEGGRLWDRFRDRVTIPIRSSRGKLIAFGGRTLGDDAAKYLNSPETALFAKSHVLYCLDRAAKVFDKTNRAIVVEGYFDCIALQTVGFVETVATLGTALSEHHAKTLANRVSQVVVCFDGDDAGRQAAITVLRTLLSANLEVSVLILPEGQDPDDIARREGATGFNQRLLSALSATDFLLEQMGPTREERRHHLQLGLDIVSVCPDSVRRFTMREALARNCGIPIDQLDAVRSPRVLAEPDAPTPLPSPGEMALLRGVLIDIPAGCRGEVIAKIPMEAIDHPGVKEVLRVIQGRLANGGTLEISAITSDIDDRDVRRLLAALEHEAPETNQDHLALITRELWERLKKKKLAELSNQIAIAEKQGDQDTLARLSLAWQRLLRQPKSS